MYKLILDDGNYNRLTFVFKTFFDLSNFLEMAFKTTNVKATVEVVTESEEENETV